MTNKKLTIAYPPAKPKPPLNRVIREGSLGSCPSCGSTVKRNWRGKFKGCHQPKCELYYKTFVVDLTY